MWGRNPPLVPVLNVHTAAIHLLLLLNLCEKIRTSLLLVLTEHQLETLRVKWIAWLVFEVNQNIFQFIKKERRNGDRWLVLTESLWS